MSDRYNAYFVLGTPIGVLRKRCSENKQQIYKKTPMPKSDFNKVALHTSAYVFSCKFAANCENTCSEGHLWSAAFEFLSSLVMSGS